jgi:hypothetical protein
MRGKAHLLCSCLRNFYPDETKRLILLQGYVVVGSALCQNNLPICATSFAASTTR